MNTRKRSTTRKNPGPAAPRKKNRAYPKSGRNPAGKSAEQSRRRPSREADPDRKRFLPTCRADMKARGWDCLDILLISGDAIIDHPAFGVPLLGRLLEASGYRVGIVAQPRWDRPDDVRVMGRPRLFCGISAGCLDSMVAHYTAFRKKRRDDAYTPGGKAGARPNRACIVYSNLVRQAFPGLPIVLGGIEASLRRAVHFDFWTNRIRGSLLLDAKADLILYGMAESSLLETARRFAAGESLQGIPGTVIAAAPPPEAEILPSLEEITAFPPALMQATLAVEQQVQRGRGILAQAHGSRHVVLMPPPPPLSTKELDALYALPFTRDPHPDATSPIPALDMVRWSVTAVRGCGGGCTFCSLSLHQGRRIRSRSRESILREVEGMTRHRAWKGSVSDVGGPTANLWGGRCTANPSTCQRRSCLSPNLCPHFQPAQQAYRDLLRAVRSLRGVKHVRIASGLRHDVALRNPDILRDLTREFVGGQLKIAPEHAVDRVLRLMRKTDFAHFERFLELFSSVNRSAGLDHYIVPYVMSAFPGCTMDDMRQLARWFRRQGWQPRQIQCFIPTPGTVATAMYYAQCDTRGQPIHVARTDRERQDQHAILTGASVFGRRDSST